MYVFKCRHCGSEHLKAEYLSIVRCPNCRNVCKLERYSPELVTKHKLLGSCSSLLRSLEEARLNRTPLSLEETRLIRETQLKLSSFLKLR
ncbi:MAG: hypothetical protein KC422_02360 [Trueperaceae bacterium]|nr:hypothetical protein [Trueperaceae bacterium]